ncbi:MAG: TonB-dependent siderophore receptor [Ramlibacter sp.]|jgi:iron complex outermembrane receptor protein|nr:TonB-dependent siderophore receptor [Ramlibacter sp.]
MNQLTPVALAACLAFHAPGALAQAAPAPAESGRTLPTVTVNASADASAEGLAPTYPGGQVARGGRAGILGTRDAMETPFSITSYTNELIQDRQARSVGEVLQSDPGVRIARGFGNYQEAFFIRGFILSSDDIAYNGLYSLLPRQYIATELFERVEVLRGASAFLTGATPGGGGLGGAINLLPKRAPNEPLNRVTFGLASGGHGTLSADVARRFGPDGATGIRVNAAVRSGGTAVDDEKAELGLASVGLDWRSRDVRLSADLGYQDNRLDRTRPSVSLGATATSVPSAPDASRNFAQPWTFSNERDVFGTLRGEWDISSALTGWAAYGHRSSEEANSLANISVDNSDTGAANYFRFDNDREDRIDTGEVGLRWKARTGGVGHEVVAAASAFRGRIDTAFTFGAFNTPTNLYDPILVPAPAIGPMPALARTGDTRMTSYALGDTLSMVDDRLLVTLGVRHQRLDAMSFGARYVDGRTSPAVGAVWRASQQLSFYANYIEGLTQGDTAPTTNPQTGARVVNGGQQFAPYVAKQKEIGVKYDAGSFGAAAALFSTTRPRAFLDANDVFVLGGEDRHDGAELSVYGEPTRGLRLLGGATWLQAKQRSTGSAATDGKRVIGVPKMQATVGAEWDVPAMHGVALDARLVHTGSSYADAANTLKVPGWTRLDLGARYLTEVAGRVVTLRARVDNVTDRNYWASSGGFPGAGYLVVGAPRTFSLSASVDF